MAIFSARSDRAANWATNWQAIGRHFSNWATFLPRKIVVFAWVVFPAIFGGDPAIFLAICGIGKTTPAIFPAFCVVGPSSDRQSRRHVCRMGTDSDKTADQAAQADRKEGNRKQTADWTAIRVLFPCATFSAHPGGADRSIACGAGVVMATLTNDSRPETPALISTRNACRAHAHDIGEQRRQRNPEHAVGGRPRALGCSDEPTAIKHGRIFYFRLQRQNAEILTLLMFARLKPYVCGNLACNFDHSPL